MIYIILKVGITSALIVAVSEIAKRSTLLGGLLASLPLVSLLAMVWLYLDTRDAARVAQLSNSILWMILPSLSFFVLFPILIKRQVSFGLALGAGIGAMIIVYLLAMAILKRAGVEL